MKTLYLLSILSLSILSFNCWSAFEKGHQLEELILKGDSGGNLDGSSWSSMNMRGKIAVMYYVDPDKKDKNEKLSQALKKRSFSREYVKFYALINMDATWLPNFAISSSLKSKQEKYPDTIYVKDYNKSGVEKWGIKDDENNVVVFDHEGHVIFSKFGKLNQKEIDKVLSLIENEVQNLKESRS